MGFVARQAIVNAAAYTNVDRAETEREICFRVNADAPDAVALAAREFDALIVHYSTDYVFDDTKESPYCEDDETNPLDEYSESKRAGERAVQQVGGR